ncbi:MAG: carboxypeptidase-like regulatory domain-containing protein [Acidobacteria bacterium]|nr:carboxypeptidase-like regulatory domain-containing protein [Acidobacteriota bacterium]MDA1233882.1 carboxypeptidase-like regulatory domain-containing protein [Acidobacteriota bacterium]
MNRLLVGLLLVPLSFALDITGRVVADHSGEPLASARVRIVRVGQKLLAADRDTDRNGKFSAPGLPEGNYRLEVSKSNHADTVVQVAGDADFIVRLVRLGVIAGRVIDANAQPISGAFVFVRTEEDADTAPLRQAIGGSAITDARGEYRAHGLFPGQYVVAASLATTQGGSRGGAVIHRDTFNISGGDDHGNVDLVMPAGSHSIQGRVTRPKEGGRYAVALAPDDHPNLTVALAYAEEGSFRLEGIPPGSYRLLVSGPVRGFSARDSLLGDSRRYGQARVDVLGQDVTGLSIEVSPGIETTFRLVSEDRLPVGVCPTSAQINLRPLEDRAAQALPGLKASFEGERVEGIAPGRYRISALDLRETCFSKPVVVEISESSRSVRIPVASAGAIEGQVLGGLGRRYVVVVVPSDLSAQPRERRLLAAYPDEQSRF